MNSQAFQIAKGIGTNIAEGNRERNDASAMGDIIRNAMDSKDPQALNSAMSQIMAGISEKGRPAAINAFEKVVDRIDKTRTADKAEIQKAEDLKNTEDALERAGYPREYAKLEKSVLTKLIETENRNKLAENKPVPQTASEKSYSKKLADQNAEDVKNIPELQTQLNNLEYLGELSRKKLSGISGTLQGMTGMGNSGEFDSLAMSTLSPILKIFNPVGALPTAKIQMVKNQFTPKSWELQSVIDGKIATLTRLANQSLKRAEDRVELFNQYEGEIPSKVAESFDRETTKMANNLIDIEAQNLKITEKQNLGQKRSKVEEGTPLTLQVVDKYLKIANNDPVMAKQMALEDGYTL